jgi:hypothetical protein
MTGGCDLVRVSLGAYAVDALDPAERRPVAAHLVRCERCRGELAELSAVAGLLRGVPLREVERVGLLVGDEFGSDGDEEARRVRRRPGRHGAVAVAVAVVAALVAAVMALVSPWGAHRWPYERGSLVSSGTDRATRVFARVTLQRRAWGTAATLSLRGVRPHLRCRLVVVARNGKRELVMTYRADYDGTADVTTKSDIPITAIASLEVLAGHDERVVQIPVHDSRSPA